MYFLTIQETMIFLGLPVGRFRYGSWRLCAARNSSDQTLVNGKKKPQGRNLSVGWGHEYLKAVNLAGKNNSSNMSKIFDVVLSLYWTDTNLNVA